MIQNIKSGFYRFYKYLKALDKIGKVVVLIGVLPLIIDIVSPLLNSEDELLINPLLALLIFALAILYANFRLYERIANPDLEVRVENYTCTFSQAINNDITHNDVQIREDFHVHLEGELAIYVNDSELSDAYFRINSIDTNWNINTDNIVGREVEVNVPGQNYVPGKPIALAGRDMFPKCTFVVDIPIQFPHKQNIISRYNFLGSLSKFDVEIRIELRDGKTVLLPSMSANIKQLHEKIQSDLIQLTINESQKRTGIVPNTIFALQGFWQAQVR